MDSIAAKISVLIKEKVDFLKTENERKERLLIEREAAIVRKDENLSKMIDRLLER